VLPQIVALHVEPFLPVVLRLWICFQVQSLVSDFLLFFILTLRFPLSGDASPVLGEPSCPFFCGGIFTPSWARFTSSSFFLAAVNDVLLQFLFCDLFLCRFLVLRTEPHSFGDDDDLAVLGLPAENPR